MANIFDIFDMDQPHFALSLPQYLASIAVCTGVWYYLRLVVQRAVARKLATMPNFVTKGKEEVFGESFWKFISFGTLSFFNVYISREYWARPLDLYNEYPNTRYPPISVIYFVIQVSNYVAALIQHLDGTEKKRSDWTQMLVHHFVTIVLIGGSQTVGLFRIGSIVLMLHDICDVILEFAKMCNYCRYKYQEVFWILLVIAWVTFRIYYFYIKAVGPVYYDINFLVESKIIPDTVFFYRTPLMLCLYCILALNLFWFSLMLKGLYGAFYKKQEFGDSREKEE